MLATIHFKIFQYPKCVKIELHVYLFIYMSEKLGLIINAKVWIDST